MNLQDDFIDALNQSIDEYELVAVCYRELLRYKKDTDNIFITRIGHLAEDPEYKMYATQFEEFRENILFSTKKMNVNDYDAGSGFEDFKMNLIEQFNKFLCPEMLSENICIPICIFYTLEAMDSYVENNLEQVFDTYKSCGPLNKGESNKDCLLYLQEKTSFFSNAYEGKEGFRKPMRSARIGAMFHSFLLLEKNRLFHIPQINPIFIKESCKGALIQKRIKIVAIPYIGYDTFRFCSFNSVGDCKSNEITGPFYVDYIPEYEEDNIKKIIELLDTAIRKEANIVVFPEFIMSEGMKNAIKRHLFQMPVQCKKNLMLVFMGTYYQWNKGNCQGNNILYVFNANGNEVGSYFKYSPFLVQSEEKIHGVKISSSKESNLPKRRQYCQKCEILSNPGEKCTLFDLVGIGRILPAICRDVIDGEFTLFLANIFMPSLLIVPAWSKSINSFDARLISLADTIHTSALVCNCCNAVDPRKKVIGRFYMPAKKRTYMNAEVIDLCRNGDCKKECKENNGCMFEIEIDFSSGKPQCKLLSTLLNS